MANIEILSEETIDKIAAGEVVERPASIVKELVENAIDAHATNITVEIKEGGISFIRVTDNGDGIDRNQVRKAFCRHATSKLRTVEDLNSLMSLGFRGEALSSIAAVAQVEIMTKTRDELIGTRYVIEGAVEKELSEIGIPNGTTIIVRNLFFNTPARRKFLKTAVTEGGYISDICEHLSLSVPNVSFKFINNGQLRFNTSGSGDLKEIIYRIYGRDVAGEMIPIERETKGLAISGFLGKPVLNRSNRNFEKFFVNGRFVKCISLSNAVEAGYKQYLMQHKFPFCIINLSIDTASLDVNVHPAKTEIKFDNEELVCDFVESNVSAALRINEMIPEAILTEEKKEEVVKTKEHGPEPFEEIRSTFEVNPIERAVKSVDFTKIYRNSVAENNNYDVKKSTSNVIKAETAYTPFDTTQLSLFDDKMISADAMEEYKVIGQIFDTYWLISYRDKLLIMDQHAAHEKVKYEAILRQLKNSTPDKQNLNPPIIITLSGKEKAVLEKFKEYFDGIGYEFDDFGGGEIAIRAVPLDLFGLDEKEVFLDVLDELSMVNTTRDIPEVFSERIATMACKAAVKGNNKMTFEELWELLSELMTLDNPYNCPHGRPTVITMSKYELEKKFKRIV